jgi:succinate dehydrogenase/fumarate reductase flavoprotein subunit
MANNEYDEADILVIGSGIAGMRAAIEAARYELDVLLVDKAVIARTSISTYAGGTMSPSDTVLMNEEERPRVNSSLSHIKPTFKDHFHNSCLVGWSLIHLGSLYPRGTIWYHPNTQGFGPVTIPMGEYVKNHEHIRCRTHLYIIDLIKNGNSVVGALGLDLKTGNLLIIKAKATILATGGAAEIFERNNVPYIATGDGQAMGYRAGLTLFAMEAMQFDAWIFAEPTMPMWWFHQCIPRRRGVIRNSEGEMFLTKYIPIERLVNPSLDPKDIWDIRYGRRMIPFVSWIAIAMAMEVRAGRGVDGAIPVDFSNNEEEDWFESPHALSDYNMFKDFDWKNKPIKVFPGALGMWGGVCHELNGRTSIDRLYAAGEVGYMPHLPVSLVIGFRAGQDAARFAKETDMPEIEESVLTDMVEEVEAIMNKSETPEGDPKEVKKIIQKVMMKYVGIVRTATELEQGIAELERIQKELIPILYARNPIQLRRALEAKNMMLVGELMARSALMREETRGIHARLDFPYMDNDNWLKNTTIKLNTITGKPELGTTPLVKTWGPKPKQGKIPADGLVKEET